MTGVVGGAGDVVGSTIEVARTTTVAALQGSRATATEFSGLVGDVMKGAIQATNEVGTELASTAKGAVIGVIRGSGEVSTVSIAC